MDSPGFTLTPPLGMVVVGPGVVVDVEGRVVVVDGRDVVVEAFGVVEVVLRNVEEVEPAAPEVEVEPGVVVCVVRVPPGLDVVVTNGEKVVVGPIGAPPPDSASVVVESPITPMGPIGGVS